MYVNRKIKRFCLSNIRKELKKVWDGYQYYPNFIEDLKDKDKGAQYRYYADVDIDNVPTEATFHNFRDRIGEEKLQDIMY